jgi:hypothetical protein
VITDGNRGEKFDCPVLFITRTGRAAGTGVKALQLPVRRRELEAAVIALLGPRTPSAPQLLHADR